MDKQVEVESSNNSQKEQFRREMYVVMQQVKVQLEAGDITARRYLDECMRTVAIF